MTEHIKRIFKQCKEEGTINVDQSRLTIGRNALVTFVTAGYPTLSDTVGLLTAMQEGGADIIELGIAIASSLLLQIG
jgi:tryptophan synthase alpha subunit